MNKLVFSVFLFLTAEASAQAPHDITSYLHNKQISKAAKDFYNGKFKADDGDKTFSILDSLNSRNNTTRPFYLYLVSRMMDRSDGALSEGLGNTVKEFLEKSPDNVIDFLYTGNKIVTPQSKSNWAKAIAGEFMIMCEDKERDCIKLTLQQTLRKVKAANKLRTTQFYKLIESYIR